MKKDKEWLKNEILGLSIKARHKENNQREWHMGHEMALFDVNKLIDQLDEPEKVVIPQFVADYYNDYKSYALTFEEWFECEEFGKGGKTESKTFEWLLDNSHEVNIERQFILADIIAHGLDGYEVEKEPHYYVAFEGEFNLLYVTHVDIYGEDGKFNYSSVFDKKHALKFTDKSKAEYLADFLGAIVVEVTP